MHMWAGSVREALQESIAFYRWHRGGAWPTRIELGADEWRRFALEMNRGAWLGKLYFMGVVIVRGDW